jgi:hypothetical protein
MPAFAWVRAAVQGLENRFSVSSFSLLGPLRHVSRLWLSVTDYDCWHPDHDNVTVEMVIKNLHKNAQTVQSVICETIKKVHKTNPDSEAFTALKFAIMTQLPTAPKMTLQKLEAILQKYL